MSEQLAPLQGRVVPRYLGLWRGTGAGRNVYASLQGWGGISVTKTGTRLTEAEREQIRAYYQEIHDAGIVQRDVNKRHWLKHPSGHLFIIDFDNCLVRDPLAPEEMVYGLHIEEELFDDKYNSRARSRVSSSELWSRIVNAEKKSVRSMTAAPRSRPKVEVEGSKQEV